MERSHCFLLSCWIRTIMADWRARGEARAMSMCKTDTWKAGHSVRNEYGEAGRNHIMPDRAGCWRNLQRTSMGRSSSLELGVSWPSWDLERPLWLLLWAHWAGWWKQEDLWDSPSWRCDGVGQYGEEEEVRIVRCRNREQKSCGWSKCYEKKKRNLGDSKLFSPNSEGWNWPSLNWGRQMVSR